MHRRYKATVRCDTRPRRDRGQRRRVRREREPLASLKPTLVMTLSPMTVQDAVAGHEFEPGMSILRISGVPGRVSAVEVPMRLPPQQRAKHPENLLLARHYLRVLEPEVYEQVIAFERQERAKASEATVSART